MSRKLDGYLLEFERLPVSHGHVVLEVRVVHDLILRQDEVLFLPLGSDSLALLVDHAFLDGYGPAGAVGLARGAGGGRCLGHVV